MATSGETHSAALRPAHINGTHEAMRERKRFTTAGIFPGVGFGGFVDGIVLHQIL
jgi:hypothetical protein